jgi:hypothetical protein
MTPAAWGALGIAVFGAISYAAGSILQAVGARRSTGTVRTLGHPLYLLGVGCDILSWAGSMVALRELAVYQVQSILAGSLAITVVMARVFLGSRIRRRDAFAVIITTGALAVLAMSAGPQEQVAASSRLRIGFCAAAVLTVLLGWLAAKFTTPGVVAGLSGLAFGGAALAGRALQLPEHPTAHVSATLGAIFTEPLTAALVTFAAAGMLMYTHALQHGQVGPVTAVLWIGEVVAPSAVGLLLLGDTVLHGWELRAAVAGFIVVASAVVLATAPGTSDAAQAAQETAPAPVMSPAGGRVGGRVGSPVVAGAASPPALGTPARAASAGAGSPAFAGAGMASPGFGAAGAGSPAFTGAGVGSPGFAAAGAGSPGFAGAGLGSPGSATARMASPGPAVAGPATADAQPAAPVSAQPAIPYSGAAVYARTSATVYAAASSTYPVWPPPNWHEPTPPPGRLADGMTVWWGPPNDRRPIFIPPDRPRTAWTTAAPTSPRIPAQRAASGWERTSPPTARPEPGWTHHTGGVPVSAQPAWMHQTGGLPVSAQPAPASGVPMSGQPDWARHTGGVPVSAQPAWMHQTGDLPVSAPASGMPMSVHLPNPAQAQHPSYQPSAPPAWVQQTSGVPMSPPAGPANAPAWARQTSGVPMSASAAHQSQPAYPAGDMPHQSHSAYQTSGLPHSAYRAEPALAGGRPAPSVPQVRPAHIAPPQSGRGGHQPIQRPDHPATHYQDPSLAYYQDPSLAYHQDHRAAHRQDHRLARQQDHGSAEQRDHRSAQQQGHRGAEQRDQHPTWAPQPSPEPAPAWINYGGVPTLAHPANPASANLASANLASANPASANPASTNPAGLRQVINAEPVADDHWPLPPQAFFPGAKSA